MPSLQQIKKILQDIKPELSSKYFVSAIGIFGSTVRGDHHHDSDIDLLVAFDRPIGIAFIDLADYVEHRLQHKVDLVSKAGIKPKYLKQIEKEVVYV